MFTIALQLYDKSLVFKWNECTVLSETKASARIRGICFDDLLLTDADSIFERCVSEHTLPIYQAKFVNPVITKHFMQQPAVEPIVESIQSKLRTSSDYRKTLFA